MLDARERPNSVVRLVAIRDALKSLPWQIIHAWANSVFPVFIGARKR
jgi:hypothetical protein